MGLSLGLHFRNSGGHILIGLAKPFDIFTPTTLDEVLMVINLSHYHNLIMILVFNFHVWACSLSTHPTSHPINWLSKRTFPNGIIQYVIKKHFICFENQRVQKMAEFSDAIYISNCLMWNGQYFGLRIMSLGSFICFSLKICPAVIRLIHLCTHAFGKSTFHW